MLDLRREARGVPVIGNGIHAYDQLAPTKAVPATLIDGRDVSYQQAIVDSQLLSMLVGAIVHNGVRGSYRLQALAFERVGILLTIELARIPTSWTVQGEKRSPHLRPQAEKIVSLDDIRSLFSSSELKQGVSLFDSPKARDITKGWFKSIAGATVSCVFSNLESGCFG